MSVAPLFLLGTHQPHWLAHAGVPLFVSDARLADRKTLPRAKAPFAVDSRGFNVLQRHGRWTVTPVEYVARVRRYRDEVGQLMWAAPQDSMCEPPIIYGGQFGREKFVGTRQFIDPNERLSFDQLVFVHQYLTVLNYGELTSLDPSLPFIPVVQGWEPWQYARCADLYLELLGVDLAAMPLVGVGSVCRRQGTDTAGEILDALAACGVTRVHMFGFSIPGVRRYRHRIAMADSLAWSAGAREHGREHGPMPGCVQGPDHPAKNCANCLAWALRWRAEVQAVANGTRPRFVQRRDLAGQMALWSEVAA